MLCIGLRVLTHASIQSLRKKLKKPVHDGYRRAGTKGYGGRPATAPLSAR